MMIGDLKVVRTNGQDEVVARAVNLIVGRAAYETATVSIIVMGRGSLPAAINHRGE
jgi:hypothetical protein